MNNSSRDHDNIRISRRIHVHEIYTVCVLNRGQVDHWIGMVYMYRRLSHHLPFNAIYNQENNCAIPRRKVS